MDCCCPVLGDDGWRDYRLLPSSSSSSLASLASASSAASSSYLSAEEDNVGAGGGCVPGRRSSFSYARLPEPLLRLSVLKLDGTSFDVLVARPASVWRLKMAVERVFSRPAEDGGIDVSWSHVWSHFCLCFEGQKLIDDRMDLRGFGIKDGDQLQFMRHILTNYKPSRRRSKGPETIPVQQLQTTSLAAIEVEEMEDSNVGTEEICSHHNEEDEDLTGHTRFRPARIFRWWLSYSKLWPSRNLPQRTRSSTPW